MPDELSPSHLRARLLQLAALIALVVVVLLVVPGFGQLRSRLHHASAEWVAVAAVLELGSALSYVVVFRAVFCQRLSWRLSYQIGMAEQAANSLLPAGGAGGLALGGWALHRGGMSADHIGRRTVAFFLLTSLANVGVLILFAALFAVGLLGENRAPAVTYAFGGAAAGAIALALWLPALTRRSSETGGLRSDAGRLRAFAYHARDALGKGVGDAVSLLRQRSIGVLAGSFGYLAFDIATLWACFRAFGHSPSFGVLVVAYIIGQLGGLLPIPIGGIEGGLIGIFVVFGVPLAAASLAVLVYRAFALWIPGLLGSAAFVQLRRTLRREAAPAAMCQPLAEPIELAGPVGLAARRAAGT
jgi:uncharacterized membrane protein YbhN (UPF0104 family)